MPTTDYQIEQMEIQESKERERAKRDWENHSCTMYSDGWCIGCQEYNRVLNGEYL